MIEKKCPACKNKNLNLADVCIKCEFPFNGSEKDKSIHIGKFISDKGIIVDSQDYLIKSQRLLGYAAAIYLLRAIISFSILINSPLDLFINAFVISVLALSAIFIEKSPLVFLLIPTFILTLIYVIEYVVDVNIFMNGIIFKIVIFGILIYSIYIYLESQKFKKKYNIK